MSSLLLKYDGGWKLDYRADSSQPRKREKGVESPFLFSVMLAKRGVSDYGKVSLVSVVEIVLPSLNRTRVYVEQQYPCGNVSPSWRAG